MKIRGGPGGLAPPVLVDMADRPIEKSADLNSFAQCAFQVLVRLFCGELCFLHVTAPGKNMYAQLALHANRHLSASTSADII